jgi:hypothetical protein
MTAKRVASAHKTQPTIAAALENFPSVAKRAEDLATAFNRRAPLDDPHDVESIFYAALVMGLDALEEMDRKLGHG